MNRPSFHFRAAAAAILVVCAPAFAGAQDWASSLYTEGGVELRVDERVFTLFAALNALGFDDAPVGRKDPIPKREFDDIRQAVRDVVKLDSATRKEFEAFFDKHPKPIRSYTAFALAVGDAPTFTVDPARLPADAKDLVGFEALLAKFYGQYKVQTIFARLVEKQRDALKAWLPVVDKPLEKAREILKEKVTDDTPRVVLVVNLLDGRGAGHGIGLKDETYLVVGPSGAGAADVTAALKAYARVLVQSAADSKVASCLKGAKELFEEVKDRNVGAFTPADYVAENLARAVAIQAAVTADKQQNAFDGQYKSGFVLIKDMNRGATLFTPSNKPLDQFLCDFLREVDAGRAVAVLRGN
jgi:hypothetical protein